MVAGDQPVDRSDQMLVIERGSAMVDLVNL